MHLLNRRQWAAAVACGIPAKQDAQSRSSSRADRSTTHMPPINTSCNNKNTVDTLQQSSSLNTAQPKASNKLALRRSPILTAHILVWPSLPKEARDGPGSGTF